MHVASFNMKILIISLAVWRISSLLAREDAPFRLLARFREWLEKQENVLLRQLSDAIHCVWCSSIWFGLLGACLISDNMIELIVNTLAISALALIVEKVNYG